MSRQKDWFTEMAGRKITVVEVARLLDVNRNTATTRLQEDGLSSDEIITLSRKLHINPVIALEELDKITVKEVFDYMDSDGTLLATASLEQLIFQAAEEALTLDQKKELVARMRPRSAQTDELAERRAAKNTPVVPDDPYDDGTVRPWDDTQPHAADNSPDEDALRWKEENPGDTHD